MNGSLQKLVVAHGMLWDADPWYRRSWFAWPQAVSLLAAGWLVLHWSFAQPTSEAPWAPPQHAEEQKGGTDIWALRDSAKTNAADFEKLKSRAANGESAAEFALGTLYDPVFNFSRLVASDVNVALSWYRQSAAQGNIDADRVLGLHYRDGVGVAADGKVALQWFRKAANAGDAFSENEVGRFYVMGVDGLTADPAEAVKWYQKSAAQGYALAARNLGDLYRNGIGVAPDSKLALQWYRKAADGGDAIAENEIGVAYEKGIDGLIADPAEAVKWYQKSAAQGNAVAAQNLKRLQQHAEEQKEGTDILALRDSAKTGGPAAEAAVQTLRSRAFKGEAAAQFALGTLYDPVFNFSQLVGDNVNVALSWYRQSAAQGNVDAARVLGIHSRDGVGVPPDGKAALQWFRKAADGGDAIAENEIGVAYEKGIDGLIADPAEAVKWYQKSAVRGNVVAAQNLKRLQK